jgi:3'(2'), 5'-bisphosphate nucleotidase
MDREALPGLGPEELQRALGFARSAAAWAGERALALRATGRWTGSALADIGDQAADSLLQGLLRGRYPLDGVLSEETRDSAERLHQRRVWIVDPLDGTREYSQLRDDWAVHVALTLDGRGALAAVALPARGQLLYGVLLPGQERVHLDGPGQLIDPTDPVPDPPRIAASRSHTPPWMERFREELGGGELVRAGSVGNKVAHMLLGGADVYVHRDGLKEWDTCAPEILARALGWSVCRMDGSEQRYNQADPRNNELVVCRPALEERVLESLARIART